MSNRNSVKNYNQLVKLNIFEAAVRENIQGYNKPAPANAESHKSLKIQFHSAEDAFTYLMKVGYQVSREGKLIMAKVGLSGLRAVDYLVNHCGYSFRVVTN